VLELNPSNGTVLNTITDHVNGPTRLAFDSLGNLWVANTTVGIITEYRAKTFQFFVEYIERGSKPLGVAVDAYGDTYIANNAKNNVVALNVGFGLVETLTTDKSGFNFSSPGALAIHGRNLYAGFGPSPGENAVISYNVGEFLTDDPAEVTVYNDNVNTGPTGIAFDSQNNVYISELYSGTAVKYRPKGGSPLLVISQGTGGCEGIAVDKHGNIFVSNSTLNNITVYNPSGTLINTLN
jgi:streptogramin lyase